MHKFLWDWTTDKTSTTWGRDQTDMNGTTFAMDLAGNSVGLTQFVTPVTTTDWDNRELGKDNGTTDGGGDFLGALDAKTDVTVLVTDSDNSLDHRF